MTLKVRSKPDRHAFWGANRRPETRVVAWGHTQADLRTN